MERFLLALYYMIIITLSCYISFSVCRKKDKEAKAKCEAFWIASLMATVFFSIISL